MSRPTPDTKAAIVADRMAGMTERAVAEKHGVTRGTVARHYKAATMPQIDEEPDELPAGQWVFCPRRRTQVWKAS